MKNTRQDKRLHYQLFVQLQHDKVAEYLVTQSASLSTENVTGEAEYAFEKMITATDNDTLVVTESPIYNAALYSFFLLASHLSTSLLNSEATFY